VLEVTATGRAIPWPPTPQRWRSRRAVLDYRVARERVGRGVVGFVRPGAARSGCRRIEAVFGDLAGEPFDAQELQRRANRQYGLNRYKPLIITRKRGDRRARNRSAAKPRDLPPPGLGIERLRQTPSNAGGEILMTGLTPDGEWLAQRSWARSAFSPSGSAATHQRRVLARRCVKIKS
jgi:hypothetical protein